MPAPLRPLSTGELLDRTFSLYRQNLVLFAGIAALPYLALSAGQVLLVTASRRGSITSIVLSGLATLAIFLGLFVAQGLTHAATTYAVSAVTLDQPINIGLAYSQVKDRIGATIAISILLSMAVGIGFVLFIVPGFIVLAKYSLGVPVTVLEKLGVRASFNRSSQLSRGSGGRILVVYFLLLILILAVSFGLAAELNLVPVLRNNAWAEIVIRLVTNVLVAPFLTIALTLLYYDQRVRKEAFDIQHMMNTLQAATGEASAAVAASNA
jgi:hypothetical protein